jgi:cytochrome c biogenesis protein CcmG, thiol:disulfide interchange protein DsbE
MHRRPPHRARAAARSALALGLLAAGTLALLALPAAAGDTPGNVQRFPAEWFYGTPQQRAVQDELVGKPMPAFDLAEWYGKEIKTNKLKGKILIVDFWATWCHPCIMAMPHNNELSEKYKSKGVVFLGVCTTPQGQARMKDVAEAQKLVYSQAKDPQSKTESAWKVQWYPTYAVADRQGRVRGVGLLPQFVEPAIQQLLEEEKKK